MASRRMISNTLGDSRKFSSLKNDLHRCAYVLLVTWADAEGRFEADRVTLKGKLYTRLPWEHDEVEAALHDMHDVGLILMYTVGDKRYGVIIDFHKHNTIRRKDDGAPKEEAPSRIPAPPEAPSRDPEPTPVPEPYRSDSGATQAKENVRESKLQPQSRATSTSASPTRAHYQSFLEAWNEHRGNLPACTTLNDKRKRGIDAVTKDHGHEALDIFTAAVLHVALDDYWVQNGYNIDNLLRPGRVLEKAEKWRSAPGMTANNRNTANIAATIARAIGGLDA